MSMKTYSARRFFVVTLVLSIFLIAVSLPIGAASQVRVGASLFQRVDSNPAIIGVDEPTFRIELLPVDLRFANNTWPLAKFDQYLDKELTEDVKRDLLESIPESGLGLDWNSWTAADLGVSGVSTRLAVRTIGTANLAPDLVELALVGNELDREYVVDGSMAGGVAFGDASVGFSLGLGNSLRIGARYHRLMGGAYFDAVATGSGTVVYAGDEPGLEGDMKVKVLRAYGEGVHGEGTAYDVGLTLQPTANFAIGVAVFDIGQIEWRDVLEETYELKLGPELEYEFVSSGESTTIVWTLPRTYQVALGYRLTPTLHLGAAYSRTVHETEEGVVYAPNDRMEAMLSWKGLGFLPIGVGMAYDQEEGFSLAGEAGLRLGPLQARVRMSDVQAVFGDGEGKDLGLMVDLGILF